MSDKSYVPLIRKLFEQDLSAASIALLMKRAGIDPAQSSSIILTTVTDVVGFLAFLGFAVIFQGYLV
jgi:magnesium transporter